MCLCVIRKEERKERNMVLEGELLTPQLIHVISEPSSSQPEEALTEIIACARAGDPFAFTKLFQMHHARILTYLVHMTGKKEEAEDIAQETFVKAWQALSSLEDPTRFLPWLYRIATFTALDHLRRQKTRQSMWGQQEDISAEREDQRRSGLEEQVAEAEHTQATLQLVPEHYRICL